MNRRSVISRFEIPLHPVLFAAFPVISLLAANAHHVTFGAALLPLGIAVGVALLAWGITYLLVGNGRRAALGSTLLLALFYGYGWTVDTARTIIGFHRMVALWQAVSIMLAMLVAVAGLVWWLRRTPRSFVGLTRFLNWGSVAAVAIALGTYAINLPRALSGNANTQATSSSMGGPDIYYIVLDGYGRDDVLQDMYDFDNGPFMKFLEDHDFYVARESFANYCRTIHSLGSTMNLTYLQEMMPKGGSFREDPSAIWTTVRQSQVLEFLRGLGYRVAAFATGFGPTEIRDADVFHRSPFDLTDFHGRLIEMTPIRSVLNRMRSGLLYSSHRARMLTTLTQVGNVDVSKGPWFVFAHVLGPHPPFVLSKDGAVPPPKRPFSYADGSFYFAKGGTREEYLAGYRDQLEAINELLREAIEEIVDDNPEAVIVVQGDHGPGVELDWHNVEKTNARERMGILNAYRLPGIDGSRYVYSNLSPVNTFRVIFHAYFGADLQLLPDASYFSLDTSPFEFINVTGDVTRRTSP